MDVLDEFTEIYERNGNGNYSNLNYYDFQTKMIEIVKYYKR